MKQSSILSMIAALGASSPLTQQDIEADERNRGYRGRHTKPTFFKNKVRAKVKAARKANRLMRKNKH